MVGLNKLLVIAGNRTIKRDGVEALQDADLFYAAKERIEELEKTIEDMLEELEVRDIPGLIIKGPDHIVKVCELITQISKERIMGCEG